MATDPSTCQSGTSPPADRTGITKAENGGTKDSTVVTVLSGEPNAYTAPKKLPMIAKLSGATAFCRSSCRVTVAPAAAYRQANSVKPSRNHSRT